ncbi:MAG: hypothetical protein ACREJQ_08840, partial [bacterium]
MKVVAMRIDFERAGKAAVKPLKAARYAERQPHEDAIVRTANAGSVEGRRARACLLFDLYMPRNAGASARREEQG